MTFYGDVFLSCDPNVNGTDCQGSCSMTGVSGCTHHVSFVCVLFARVDPSEFSVTTQGWACYPNKRECTDEGDDCVLGLAPACTHRLPNTYVSDIRLTLLRSVQVTVTFFTDALGRSAKATTPKHSGGGLSRVSSSSGWVS